MLTARPLPIVGHRRGTNLATLPPQRFHRRRRSRRQQRSLRSRVTHRGAADLAGLHFGELPGTKRGFSRRQLVERPGGTQRLLGGTDRHPGLIREPVRTAAKPLALPGAALLHPTRGQALPRRAQPLTPCETVGQARGTGRVEHLRFQACEERLEVRQHTVEDLELGHGTPPAGS